MYLAWVHDIILIMNIELKITAWIVAVVIALSALVGERSSRCKMCGGPLQDHDPWSCRTPGCDVKLFSMKTQGEEYAQ